MPEYRAGIIGCGSMGKGHARGYEHTEYCRVVAATDPNAEAVGALAEEFGIESSYEDYREMLQKENLDFVSVCTWPTTHCEITVAAAETRPRGIICEKPLAVTLPEADRMIESCAGNGVTLATGHQHRFDAQAVQARDWIREGRIGEPEFFWGHCGLDLMNNGTHVLDLIHFFNGDEPAEWIMGAADWRTHTRGRRNHPDMFVEDASIGEVRYRNGLRAAVELGSFAPQAYQFHLKGTDGVIDVNVPDGPKVRLLSGSGSGWEIPEISQPVTSTVHKVADFVKAALEGSEPTSSARIGRQVLEVIVGVFESVRRRALIECPVQVDDFPLRTMMESGEI